MMTLLLCLLVWWGSIIIPTATANFSNPRIIHVNPMRRATFTPRRRRQQQQFGGSSRMQLYASSDVTLEDEDDDEAITEEDILRESSSQKDSKIVNVIPFEELTFGPKVVRLTTSVVGTALGGGGMFAMMSAVLAAIRGIPGISRNNAAMGTSQKQLAILRWQIYSGKIVNWMKVCAPIGMVYGGTGAIVWTFNPNVEFTNLFIICNNVAMQFHNRNQPLKRKAIVLCAYTAGSWFLCHEIFEIQNKDEPPTKGVTKTGEVDTESIEYYRQLIREEDEKEKQSSTKEE